MFYFLTVDQNGKIIKKAKLLEYFDINDVILAKNEIIASSDKKLKIFKLE